MKTFAEEWLSFVKGSPKTDPDIVEGSRKVFYAGARTFIALIDEAAANGKQDEFMASFNKEFEEVMLSALREVAKLNARN